ncbi:helix-turn-helix domain-containing protein [Phytohabitans sp. ZYX-F-186]|uniref:Helix-turn-helix domain-containing protein n=1 Tax=Phytohabitans maris TaxID=3071409 RepID=A0ABU0ZTF0_9ACTN|nr:helix-turn-helix domain-containing protein [Phytohabitans sp. ZYX-F-186]MDQ7910238.1 helix-turn-helix domain-containing protein [Phytohabitans sp. ZYX-F-186]
MSKTATREPLASTEEVASFLKITPAALLQMRHAGLAPAATKVGTRLRWDWADVDRWIDHKKSTSSKPGDRSVVSRT